MGEENKDLELTPEERTAEEEAAKDVSDDELKSKLATDLGIDPNEQPDLFNKVFEREKLNRQRLSGAIKQKISWREKAKQTSQKPEGNAGGQGQSQQNGKPVDPYEAARNVFREEMDNQTLAQLDLPDDLKAEVKDLAKLKGISIREAAQNPYIQSRKAEIERQERIKAATPQRSNKGSVAVSYDPSKPLNPDDFKTPDGNMDVKAWNEAKAARARHREQNS